MEGPSPISKDAERSKFNELEKLRKYSVYLYLLRKSSIASFFFFFSKL